MKRCGCRSRSSGSGIRRRDRRKKQGRRHEKDIHTIDEQHRRLAVMDTNRMQQRGDPTTPKHHPSSSFWETENNNMEKDEIGTHTRMFRLSVATYL